MLPRSLASGVFQALLQSASQHTVGSAWSVGRLLGQQISSSSACQMPSTSTPASASVAPAAPMPSASSSQASTSSAAAPALAQTTAASLAVPLGKNTAVLASTVPSWPSQPEEQQRCRAKYRPWDPTRSLTVKSSYSKRMGFLVQALEEEQVQALQAQRNFPDFASGDVLEVRMLVPENQRRQYVYRGVCIARYNKGIRSAFKLYNVFPDGGGVVQHIPLHMPDLVDIKVIGKVHAGSRVKKYHILEDSSSTYSFQKQVRPYREAAAGEQDAVQASSAGGKGGAAKAKKKA